ncbi:MAG: glutaminyl-peptide cyclotransferase [Bacteroidia bacterium]|jgi:glutaminyl-peptide cyclotransferase
MVQTGRWMRSLFAGSFILLLLFGCNMNRNSNENLVLKPAPEFNADSAYGFVRQQVEFGPRIPNSEAHHQCGDYLVSTLARLGATVVEQKDSVEGYDGTMLPIRNVIASFSPNLEKRILLASNWDTRAWADRSDSLPTLPADGANDGASGVGVLLEIARVIGQDSLPIGIDIILFDMEDQDRPAYDINPNQTEHFGCLGTRYWSEHLDGYEAEFAIFLDMVGAENAKFALEGNSMKFAESVVRKVWDIGNKLGYEDYFIYNRTLHVQDDHAYVNEITGIPSIDIIQYDPNGIGAFWKHWHTHQDNIDAIDRETLGTVGHTLLQVIYNED